MSQKRRKKVEPQVKIERLPDGTVQVTVAAPAKGGGKMSQQQLLEKAKAIAEYAITKDMLDAAMREFARMGGEARAKKSPEELSDIARRGRQKLSKTERRRIAKIAAAARWAKQALP